MHNRIIVVLFGVILCLITFVFYQHSIRQPYPTLPAQPESRYSLPDGVYRGGFFDEGKIQVNVQFSLRDGVVQEARFRHLRADESFSMDNKNEPYKSIIAQYEETLQYLVGKELRKHLEDLYAPENIVTVEVDGYSGASIRSSKIISAIRDAINRGVYQFE